MKWFALPIATAVVIFSAVARSDAQSGIRYLATAGGKSAKVERKPSARLTSQTPSDVYGNYAAGEAAGSGQYIATDDPGVPGDLAAGYAYTTRPGGNYGYNPDFGYGPGGMSVWPGVPACCDPWFGYCGEPRCNHCSCGKGQYQYIHCRHGSCEPELVTWGKHKCEKCEAGCCSKCTTCPTYAPASYSPTPADEVTTETRPAQAPKSEAAPNNSNLTDQPAAKRAPPRNKLPKIPLPSALGKSDSGRG